MVGGGGERAALGDLQPGEVVEGLQPGLQPVALGGQGGDVDLRAPWAVLMAAFMAKASSWPVTIMSWSMATIDPRMRLGAVSAR